MFRFCSKPNNQSIPQNILKYRKMSQTTKQQQHNKSKRTPIPFITKLKQTREPNEALSLFHHYTELGNFTHDYPSYSSLLYKLVRARRFDAIEPLLSRIKDLNLRCKETLFIVLMQHYGKAGLVDKALEVFNQMPGFNCLRSLQSFNALVNVLVDCGRFVDAKRMFERVRELGFRPNSVSYNVLIKGWLKCGEFGEAVKVFDEMVERGVVEPTVVSYNSLIGFLCRSGEVERGMGLVEDMKRKGKRPNAVTYGLLMEGLCLSGKYNDAKKLMFDMEYRGCRPRVVNFGVLLSDLGRRGMIDEAKSLLVEMKKRGFKPDVVIYNILVNCLCKEGNASEAYKFLIEMQIKGCEPNAATYRMMVDGFCRVGEFERGLKLLNAMLTSGHCPRVETFQCMVAGLLKGMKIDEAGFVFEEMQKRNMRFDSEAWEILVRDACDREEGADELVNEVTMSH